MGSNHSDSVKLRPSSILVIAFDRGHRSFVVALPVISPSNRFVRLVRGDLMSKGRMLVRDYFESALTKFMLPIGIVMDAPFF